MTMSIGLQQQRRMATQTSSATSAISLHIQIITRGSGQDLSLHRKRVRISSAPLQTTRAICGLAHTQPQVSPQVTHWSITAVYTE